MVPDLTSLSLTSWAGIVAGGAIIGSCWRYIRMGVSWFGDLFVCRVYIKEDAARAVMTHVWSKGTPSPFGARIFGGVLGYVAPKKRMENIAYEDIMTDPKLCWWGRVPFVLKKGMTGKDGNNNGNLGLGGRHYNSILTLYFFRRSLDVEKIIIDATNEYNEQKRAISGNTNNRAKKRFSVNVLRNSSLSVGRNERSEGASLIGYDPESDTEIIESIRLGELRSLVWSPNDLSQAALENISPFECHPVSSEVSQKLEHIDRWLKHEDWFRSRGIPWRIGYLLYGETGTGKSTIVKNVALKYDLPIYSFDLASQTNESFSENWKKVMQNAPAIALLEDFDSTFSGRTNIAVQDKMRDGLTFDCLLNTISGVGASDGVILFVTTNHVQSLDSALGVARDEGGQSTRPGRLDHVIYVGPMLESERRRLAARILSDWPEIQDRVVKEGEGETAAQFQDRCAQLALQRWKELN